MTYHILATIILCSKWLAVLTCQLALVCDMYSCNDTEKGIDLPFIISLHSIIILYIVTSSKSYSLSRLHCMNSSILQEYDMIWDSFVNA